MYILITGCAGFIGFHTSKIFVKKNIKVVGIDNINNYYDVKLKKNRLDILKKNNNFIFHQIDITKKILLNKLFKKYKFKNVIHLAAQAGVRNSIKNTNKYFKDNFVSFYNIIDISKQHQIKNFLYASSSSVYGNQNKFPTLETINTDKPLNFYAASKKSNEIIASAYSSTSSMNCIGMRFFTVYGPFGRPDMSYFKFTKNIYDSKPINLYNYGKNYRDFTFVDDVAKAIYKLNLLNKIKKNNIIVNIGKSKPVTNMFLIKILEKKIGKKAKIILTQKQVGDSEKTHSNNKHLLKLTNIKKFESFETGINKFVNWYKEYYNV